MTRPSGSVVVATKEMVSIHDVLVGDVAALGGW